jgi:DNA polymerase-4
MPLRSLFVDFNSYFASVEQQVQPHLRHHPVAVVPSLAETTCCIAASYEAKAHGIKTGTKVWEARKLCPKLRLAVARPQLYVEYHHRLVAAVESCIPVRAVQSIDEMTCDLTGSQQSRVNSIALAQHIKATIASDVGSHLRCSIGIAPNSFLAKTATEMQKPDGLVVIEPEQLPECLYELELRDFCGIGARIEQRLYLNGIVTVRQLCEASCERLRRVWGGIEGERFYRELRGELVYHPPTRRASVSHSRVLPPEQRHLQGAYAVLSRLLQKAAARLRRMEMAAATLEVGVRFTEGHYWGDKIRFPHTTDTLSLMQRVTAIWHNCPRRCGLPLKVSVVLGALRPVKECNLSLFENHGALDERMDYLNDSYGPMKVYLGSAHTARSTAAQPIAFQYVPEIVEKPRAKLKIPEERFER